MTYIWVQNLSFDTRAEDVRQLFQDFGEVHEVKLPLDHLGASRCFAYILMPDVDAANRAIQELNRGTLHGCTMRVQEISENSTGLYYSPGRYSLRSSGW